MSVTLKDLSPVEGKYYLVPKDKVDELYKKAGFAEDDDEVPNFVKLDGKECLFTENFIEMNGKEYEIVIVAEKFSWEDIVIYDIGDDELLDDDE